MKGTELNMNNLEFLTTLKKSFLKYLETGARSNEKLKILHGAAATDILEKLNVNSRENYSVFSLGYGKNKEQKITGRYIDKSVDITVCKNNLPVAGIAVKFVMSNYMQNSNNYFENMLGETANIRCGNIPYFQIFIIPDKVPYFDINKKISKWESINSHNLKKYIKLSNDDTNIYLHTPNKTLISIINISGDETPIYDTLQKYKDYYLHTPFSLQFSDKKFAFGNTIIYNDYESFSQKIVYSILSI